MGYKIMLICIGFIIAILKVLIEYDYWVKKKNELRFHQIGFIIVFIFLCGFYYLTRDVSYILIIILAYWNAFELSCNYFHNKEILYVGNSAQFDKLLRRIDGKIEVLQKVISIRVKKNITFPRIKLILHIITVGLLVYLIHK